MISYTNIIKTMNWQFYLSIFIRKINILPNELEVIYCLHFSPELLVYETLEFAGILSS